MASTEKEDQRSSSDILRFALKAAGLLFVLLLLIRTFVFAPYSIPSRSMSPAVIPGDVLLVNKLPYYIRTPSHLPFTKVTIPYLEIPGLGTIERGEVAVFSSPEPGRSEGSAQLVKRIAALPGDQVRLSEKGVTVRHRLDGTTRLYPGELPRQIAPLLAGGREVTVPYEGYELEMNGATAARWSKLLRREGIEVDYRNNIVFLNGKPSTHYRFNRDFLFLLGDNPENSRDSRSFGFVPQQSLIGEAVMVVWSREGVWGRVGTWVE